MTFLEAREALHNGKKIRHESMPEGNWIMVYRRGFGSDLLILVDAMGNLSGDRVDFIELFWSTLHEDDEGWDISDGGRS